MKLLSILSLILLLFWANISFTQCNLGVVTGNIDDCQVLTRNQYRCYSDSVVLKNTSTFSGGASIDSVSFSCSLTIPSHKGFSYNDTSCNSFKLNINPDSCVCSNNTSKNYAEVEMELEVFEKCNGGLNSRGYDKQGYRIFFNPRPEFSVTKDSLCIDLQPFKFTLNCFCQKLLNDINLNTKYSWDFGDDSITTDTSSQPNPSYSYNQAGTYWVKCTASNTCGTKTDSLQVTVLPKPKINSISNFPDTLCSNSPINLTINATDAVSYLTQATSSKVIITNGNTSSPTINFTDTGTFSLTFTVQGKGLGVFCKQFDTTIKVYVSPSPSMSVSKVPDFCAPNNTTYTLNYSTHFSTSNNQQTNRFILFKVGSGIKNQYLGVGIPPPFTIDSIGSYIVIDSSYNNCDTLVVRDTFEILPQPIINSITNFPTTKCTNTSISPTINATNATTYSTVSNITKDSIFNASTANPTIQFNDTGWHTITFTVKGVGGVCSKDTQLKIYITPIPTMNLQPIKDTCFSGGSFSLVFSKHFSTNDTQQTNKFYVLKTGSGVKFQYNNKGIPPSYPIDSVGTYIVIDSSMNQCDTVIVSDTFEVVSPVVLSLPPTDTTCINTSIQLPPPPTGVTIRLNGTVVTNTNYLFTTSGTFVFDYIPLCGSPKSYTVVVFPNPDITQTPIPDSCFNPTSYTLDFKKFYSSSNSQQINNFYVIKSGGGISFQYSGTGIPPPYTIDSAGTYFVIDSSWNRCDTVITLDTFTLAEPVVINLPDNDTICAQNTITLPTIPQGVDIFLNQQKISDTSYYFPLPGTYTFQYKPRCGSSSFYSVIVRGTKAEVRDTTVCFDNPQIKLTGNPTPLFYSGLYVSGDTFSVASAGSGIHVFYASYTDGSGCVFKDTGRVFVEPLLKPSYSAPDTVCLGSLFSIKNITPNTTSEIIFNNGSTLTKNTLDTVLQKGGWYYFSLRLKNSQGYICAEGVRDSLFVIETTIPSFSAVDTLCEGNTTQPTINGSPVSGVSYFWKIRGQVFTGFTPPIITAISTKIGTIDTLPIEFIAQSVCKTISLKDTIWIITKPVAGFGLIEQDRCSPDTVTFVNYSQGNSLSYYWRHNGILFSTDSIPPAQIFKSNGYLDSLHTVSLLVSNGCVADSTQKSITIEGSDFVSSFLMSKQKVCPHEEVTFEDGLGRGFQNGFVSYFFGDGVSTITKAGTTIKHIFKDSGIYRVTVVITNNCHVDSTHKFVTVRSQPTFSTTVDTLSCNNAITKFSAQQISGNPIAKWQWSFGDGKTDSLQNTQNVYSAPTTYTWNLQVNDIFNCINEKSGTVQIFPTPNVLLNGGDTTICFGTSFPIQVDSALSKAEYSWTINRPNGTDTTIITYDGGINYSFSEIGEYRLSVTATNTNYILCKAVSKNIKVTVRESPKITKGIIPIQSCSEKEVVFDAPITSTHQISNWSWQFGDGESSTSQKPSYKYSSAGVFTWRVNMTDFFGCSVSDSGVITINQTPNVRLDNSDERICVNSQNPKKIVFKADSLNTLLTLNTWYIEQRNGIKGNYILDEFEWSFKDSGEYKIFLFSKDLTNNCTSQSDTITIWANLQPIAEFSYDIDNTNDVSYKINFTNESEFIYHKTQFIWDLGRNFSEYQKDVEQEYPYPDILPEDLNIRLTVFNEECRDTVSKTITICPSDTGIYMPNAFTPNNDNMNDRFKPIIIFYNSKIKMSIFNRWGQKIYSEEKLYNDMRWWDGYFEGKPIPDGVYIYTISYKACTLKEGKIYSDQKINLKGNVTLLR